MKKNKIKRYVPLVLTVITLVGCQSIPVVNQDNNNNDDNNDVNAISTDYYPSVVNNGKYTLSSSRGIVSSATSDANLRNMERDLYDLAKGNFSTSNYSFQEGKALSSETISKWLSPKSDENPDGLNPANSASTDSSTFEPHYLNTLLEYDLMKKNGDSDQYNVAGVSIALAMNCEDSVKKADGTKDTVKIDQETALSKGKEAAQTVLKRLRQVSGYENVPIQIAIFYDAPTNDLGGGSFIAQSLSNNGETLGDWKSINRDYVVYGVDTPPNQEDSTAFSRFRQEIEGFYPQLSGVSAIGCYDDGKLSQVTITINSQFDGYTETIALVQQATESANAIFNKEDTIRITINGPSGTTATMNRKAGNSNFKYVIF